MAMVIDRETCIGCGTCVGSCPNGAVILQNGIACVTSECVSCGMCVDVCPVQAIENRKEEVQAQTSSGVWVFAQQINGEIQEVAFELLGKAREIADVLGESLTAVVLGTEIKEPQLLIRYGADEILWLESSVLSGPVEMKAAKTLTEQIRQRHPSVVLFGATAFGRTLAPMVAADVGTGLTADCTQLDIDPETGLLQQTRPAFGGNLMATIVCPVKRPQMATVRPGVMKKAKPDEMRAGKVTRIACQMETEPGIIVHQIMTEIQKESIAEEKILIVAGRGIGSKKNMRYVKELARLMGAGYGVSRPLVDAGWAEYSHQVGQTGCSVAPDLLISVGVSGAIQHLAGIGAAKTILAINTDAQAPIMGVCRHAWVGDCVAFLKAAIEQMQNLKTKEI